MALSSLKVSVIIPSFNRAQQLCTAIASVLSQTVPPLDCIVVDDGSVDGTEERVLREFNGRIRYFHQENRGVSSARNLGIRAARGEWLAFLDSDDEWLPQKLQKQLRFIEEHPEARICQTTEQWTRKGKRVNPGVVHKKKDGELFFESLERCMITPSSVMIQKTLLDEVGLFDESMPVCEDYDLWLRITVTHPVYLLNEELLIRHGGNPDQLSASHSMDKYRIYSLQKLLAQAALSVAQREATIRILRDKCRIYGQGCLRRGRAEEAMGYLALVEKEWK